VAFTRAAGNGLPLFVCRSIRGLGLRAVAQWKQFRIDHKGGRRVVVSGAFAALLALGCNEYVEKDYRTLAEARQAGMVEKGWMPSATPKDATSIHFEGWLDEHGVFGRFSSTDTSEIRKQCTAAKRWLRVPGDRLRYVDRGMRDAATAADLEKSGYEVFSCPDRMALAIRSAERRAVYWSVRN
jgi:hypothetical protein